MVLHLLKTAILGSVNIGVYLNGNNKIFLIPPNLTQKTNVMVDALSPPENKIKEIELTINQSYLLGSYICMNNKGLILPSIIKDEELAIIKNAVGDDMNVGIIDTVHNTFGNLICANDNGAIISPLLKDKQKEIEEILGIGTSMVLNIAGLEVAGSCLIANSTGCLCHPITHDRHIEAIGKILKVEVDVSTINCGNPYLRSGALVNDYGGLFGRETTGPEAQRFSEILNLM